eukprot:8340570-Alexandrium_andersonii.AAC.1
MAAVLHQASFRVYAWEGIPARGAAVAAAAIVRAAGRGGTGAEADADEPRDGPVWATGPNCDRCGAAGLENIQEAAEAHGVARMRQADGPDVVALPIWADGPVAEWPGPGESPGETSAPWPAVVGDGPIAARANAKRSAPTPPGQSLPHCSRTAPGGHR